MNYKYCTECGVELIHIDAKCHECITLSPLESLPTLRFEVKEPAKKMQFAIRKAANKMGVKNAYQFQKVTGFSSSLSCLLWKDDLNRIDLRTLNTLCNLFDCTPNDIIVQND